MTVMLDAMDTARRASTNVLDVLVVKIGGGAGLDLERCLADLAQVARQRPVVIVHGVSDTMNRLCAERGVPVRTLTSPSGHESRYTDPATRDLFVEATGLVGAQIVRALAAHGVRAAVVSGAIHGARKAAIRAVVNGRVVMIRDDYSGTITHTDPTPIRDALAQGLVPVVAPLAASPDGWLNVDGDRASASVAAALGAADLVILSNVRGLYRRYPDESSLIDHVPAAQIETALDAAQGRMKRKVLGAQEALRGGVRRVIVADGRAPQPVSAALNGAGTVFC
ncbi:[LysW]-aminoadipate kinase (plasmid) [Aggregatilineales bacterium SYSU G02658]